MEHIQSLKLSESKTKNFSQYDQTPEKARLGDVSKFKISANLNSSTKAATIEKGNGHNCSMNPTRNISANTKNPLGPRLAKHYK